MLSKKAKYAIKALLALHNMATRNRCGSRTLARQESLPQKFLELILLELRNAGAVRSRKGRGGGYLLARPPERILLGQVVRLFDGPLAPVPCASQTAYVPCADCADEATCGVRLAMKAGARRHGQDPGSHQSRGARATTGRGPAPPALAPSCAGVGRALLY